MHHLPPQHQGGGGGASEGNPLAGADQGTIQALLAQAGLLGAGQHMGLPTGAAAGMSATTLPVGAAQGLPPSTSLMLSATGAPAVMTSTGSATGEAAASVRSAASTPPPAGPASTLTTLLQSVGSGGVSPPPVGAALSAGPNSAPPSYLGTSPASSSPRTGSGRASPAVSGMAAAANPVLSRRSAGSDGGSPLGRYGPVGGGVSLPASAEDALVAQMAAVATCDAPLPAGWTKVRRGSWLPLLVPSAASGQQHF